MELNRMVVLDFDFDLGDDDDDDKDDARGHDIHRWSAKRGP